MLLHRSRPLICFISSSGNFDSCYHVRFSIIFSLGFSIPVFPFIFPADVFNIDISVLQNSNWRYEFVVWKNWQCLKSRTVFFNRGLVNFVKAAIKNCFKKWELGQAETAMQCEHISSSKSRTEEDSYHCQWSSGVNTAQWRGGGRFLKLTMSTNAGI